MNAFLTDSIHSIDDRSEDFVDLASIEYRSEFITCNPTVVQEEPLERVLFNKRYRRYQSSHQPLTHSVLL